MLLRKVDGVFKPVEVKERGYYAQQKQREAAAIAKKAGQPKTYEQPADWRRNLLLEYLKEHPSATLQEAMYALDIPRSTINIDVGILKAEGRLKRIGSRKTGSWGVVEDVTFGPKLDYRA